MSILYTIYTPREHICLAQVVSINGERKYRIKKAGKDSYEILSLEEILKLLLQPEVLS